jgi:sugar phosphate isomerase/epimerase
MDLITFFSAEFWGLENYQAVRKPNSVPPEIFWDRVLDVTAETGITGIELTAGIGSYRSALARYGTAASFAAALDARGLAMCSGFYPGLVYSTAYEMDSSGSAWRDPARKAEILDEVREYATFIREAGSDVMVMGLPLRQSWNADPPAFVNLDYASELADLVNVIGYTAMREGVRVAMHTETRSTFWLRRDIDLFLMLTDPVYVDFCPDTAHIALGGTNPVDVLADHHTRVSITHWKDTLGTVSKSAPIDADTRASLHALYTRVGTGIVDWHAWSRKLHEVGYSGWAIIELDAAADPGGELAAAQRFVEVVTKPIYS